MIDSEYGSFFLVCDICGYPEGNFDSFDDAVDYKKTEGKQLGWSARKFSGEWADICPECNGR